VLLNGRCWSGPPNCAPAKSAFHRLTELSSDWYWEQDVGGRFTQVSGPALEMLGIRGNDAPDKAIDVQGPRWNEAERAALEANIAGRRPFLDFIYSRINVDGSQQYFQVSGEPIIDASAVTPDTAELAWT